MLIPLNRILVGLGKNIQEHVFMKKILDRFVNPTVWFEWDGNFALDRHFIWCWIWLEEEQKIVQKEKRREEWYEEER